MPHQGCAPQAPQQGPNEAAQALARSEQSLISANGTYRIVYLTDPTPIPLNEPFAIRVKVFDGRDQSRLLSDVQLDVDGRMPHHRHGMNRQPIVSAHGDGFFDVAGMLFHMPGRWELYFDVTRDGQTERGQAVIHLD
ncbi:MAG: hypothetical protein L0Y44_10875 [Phycisphaerales bacterium]|nr:hypothetical protein [Phycisphaerales bacterium]MCI0631141.1 hypothetical protein [Phycisphaerales bacterium]